MTNRTLNIILTFVFIVAAMLFQTACKTKAPSDLSKESIIPRPVSITATGEYFCLNEKSGIFIQDGSEELKQVAEYLAEGLKPATGFDIEVKTDGVTPGRGSIYLTLTEADTIPGDEGYVLTITKKLITLSARKPAGLFRGIQTIRQLLPAAVEPDAKQEKTLEIATGTIFDYPVYGYRGAMLDVARHFFGVDDVKRFIDLIAAYKMNALHLHLSDDQGWRIEIKSWPNLALHGGSTEVGGGEGGYFTQEQYSEIVKYADTRHIIAVPEIDMPGHTNAALASYAGLNCNGKATELYTGTEVGLALYAQRKRSHINLLTMLSGNWQPLQQVLIFI